MFPDWKLQELLALVRRRYPDWENFSHPAFVADEITPKRASVQKAHQLLSQTALDELLAHGDFDGFIDRLNRLAKDNNLLWRMAPSSGDTAVLYHPGLDTPAFCTQVRNLLYGDRPSPERLQTFTDYLKEHDLPNKWPFATYYLFLCHPESDIFVKPRTARWFLKFVWMNEPEEEPDLKTKVLISMLPGAGSYNALLAHSAELRQILAPFGARDMVDVQSFIWVCEQENRTQTGQLDARGQVELDVPPSLVSLPVHYQVASPTAVLQETSLPDSAAPAPPGTQLANQTNRPYSLADCAAETGWSEEELHRWVNAIERKGQAILYGPPGTGKTFMAQKVARHLASQGDGFGELVQFHPAYTYEAFVQGIRPLTDAQGHLHYELVYGRFRQFCARAAQHTGPCVLIIDEINRANLPSVLGELMYLLEYRQAAIELAEGNYTTSRFTIPANVRLIGTMNTADRSIALVDHALRRRFAFIHLPPNPETLRHYHRQTGYNPNNLIKIVERLNRQIADPHYAIGYAFFMHPMLPAHLADIWRMEIEPYLEEYFFDQPDQVELFRWAKLSIESS
jgi:hypothetical protein